MIFTIFTKRPLLLLTLLSFFAAIIIVGCSDGADPDQSDGAEPTLQQVAENAAPLSESTETPIPTVEEPTAEPTDSPPTETPTSTPEPTATHTPTPPPPLIFSEEGENRIYSYPFEGITMPLSNGWRIAELTTQQIDSELNELYTSELFQTFATSGMLLYAVQWSDESLASESPANINLVIQTVAADLSLEAAADQFINQISYNLAIPSEEILQEPTQLGENPAVWYQYNQELVTPNGDKFILVTNHIVAKQGEKRYLLTYTTPDTIAAVAEADLCDCWKRR